MATPESQLPLPLPQRPIPNVVCLFDVDGPLTPARQLISPEMYQTLRKLREKVAIGFVGGSDQPKQIEQLCSPFVMADRAKEYADADAKTVLFSLFDYCFSEGGLVAYRQGKSLGSESFIARLGDDRYNKLIRFVLRELADLEELPFRRGTFVELRRGMVNICPIGRSASTEERNEFEKLDKKLKIRERLVAKLRENFADYDLVFAIGGQVSFDVFPVGWDKTYCLRYIPDDAIIHFFGDKTSPGGNDYEIFSHPRTIGHTVENPEETMKLLNELFLNDKA